MNVKQFRKLPVVIDAVQYVGGFEASDVLDWIRSNGGMAWIEEDSSLSIQTLEGSMRCDLLDYVIRGVKGEFYPCKPDIFEATYDRV